MKRLGIALITITFVLGGFLSAWSAASPEEQTSYKKEVKEKLKGLDQKIAELKKKATEVKGEAKADYDKEMAELGTKQKAAKKEWRKLAHATATDWEKVKAGMDRAVQDVESAYDKAASRFKEHKD
jgi:chromosome segregation ATPase